MNEIITKIKKPKSSKKDIHIQINLDNNIIIGYVPSSLITEYAIIKDSQDLNEETLPLNHSFSLYEKIMAQSPIPSSSIKKFDKEEIKEDKNYIFRENMEEKDIIPMIYNENEEEIKYLEKSLEKSIDKSFDKSYEKSFDKSLNNLSINDSQNLSQSNNQSLSYNENSFNASRNSIERLSGKNLLEQIHRLFSGSINKEIEEEKNSVENNDSLDNSEKEDKKENDSYNNEEEENINENEGENDSSYSNDNISKDDDEENKDKLNHSS